MNDDLSFLSASELVQQYEKKAVSPVEVTDAILHRIEQLNTALNAFVTVTPDLAQAAAVDAERAYARESAGPLAGVPVSIKDLTPVAGVRTTMGSLLYASNVPDYDAPFVERVKAAGGVVIGMTNSPEFGWKGETTNRVSGTTHNPWNLNRTPGGSSGGGAAAVAAGLGPLAQGSDGAGSVRIPCGFTGIFGFKPSFGSIPQYPPSAVGDLSHLGPMTRTVTDAALLMTVVAGEDPRDRLSRSPGIDYLAGLENTDLTGMTVAWSRDLGYAKVESEVAEVASAAARVFEELGATLVEDHPAVDDPWPLIEPLWSCAMAGLHEDNLDEVRDLIDPGRLRVIEHARTLSGPQLAGAHQARNQYADVMRQFMEGYDLLLTPTLPCTAFPVGLDFPETLAGSPTTYLGWTAFTYPFNLTGQPAATVPAGLASDGLPVGLQIVGRWRDDMAVLRAARSFEKARPWADQRPPAPFGTDGQS